MSDTELERIKALKMQRMLHGMQEEKKEVKIEVYTTNTCPYCHMAKEYLRQKGVSFEDINLSANPQKAQYMMSNTGQTGVPQINIGGHWVVGFDRARIDALLSLDE